MRRTTETIDSGGVVVGLRVVDQGIAFSSSHRVGVGFVVSRDEIPLVGNAAVTAGSGAGRGDDGRGAAQTYRLGTAVNSTRVEGGMHGDHRGVQLIASRRIGRTHRVGASRGNHHLVGIAGRSHRTAPLIGNAFDRRGRQRGGRVGADSDLIRRDSDCRKRVDRYRDHRILFTALVISNCNRISIGTDSVRCHVCVARSGTVAPFVGVAWSAAIHIGIDVRGIARTNRAIRGAGRDHQCRRLTNGDVGRGRAMVGIRGRHRVVTCFQASGSGTGLRRRGTPLVVAVGVHIGHRGCTVFATVTVRIGLGDDRRVRFGRKGDRHIGRFAVTAFVGDRYHNRGVGKNFSAGIR